MFDMGATVYLVISRSQRTRTLHQGRVIAVQGDTVVGEFIDPIVPPVGTSATLCTTEAEKFYRQEVQVMALRQTEPTLVAGLKLLGQPEQAEMRGSYRVSTETLDIRARIGQDTWQVVDVSPEGFAVLTRRMFPLGASISATLMGEGFSCTGMARLATLRRMPDGSMRYGLLAELDGKFAETLKLLTVKVQEAQSRRLTRMA